MTNGQLLGEILDLWRSAITLWYVREHRGRSIRNAAPRCATVRPDMWPGKTAGRLRVYDARADQLMLGMEALGVDVDEFYARYGLLHHDMEQSCAGCRARSRCRRDLATGDFTRRYRHYCPNAPILTELAANPAPTGRA